MTDLQNGMFELIFASPETLLESYREVMLQLAKTGFLLPPKPVTSKSRIKRKDKYV